MPLQHLGISERARVTVKARPRDNATNLLLCAGERYLFDAQGAWRDAFVSCDANGWESALYKPFKGSRRKPAFRWLALIGYLKGHSDNAFLIGSYREHQCAHEGELVCYANDAESMYWNNFGSIELTVTRTA